MIDFSTPVPKVKVNDRVKVVGVEFLKLMHFYEDEKTFIGKTGTVIEVYPGKPMKVNEKNEFTSFGEICCYTIRMDSPGTINKKQITNMPLLDQDFELIKE